MSECKHESVSRVTNVWDVRRIPTWKCNCGGEFELTPLQYGPSKEDELTAKLAAAEQRVDDLEAQALAAGMWADNQAEHITKVEAELARAREALIFMWTVAGGREMRGSAEQHYEREIAQGDG